jgi:glyoxylase-like metal-dependent hydrolase (beta-lactamase superfamily II)
VAWSEDLDQARIWGHPWNEIVFLHRRSRTLIVGDCFFALGPESSRGLWLWTGALPPRPAPSATPRPAARQLVPWRLTKRDRRAISLSVEHVLTWDFDRVIVGHGEIVQGGGREALRDAYSLNRAMASPNIGGDGPRR